jgi:hypothetical protein
MTASAIGDNLVQRFLECLAKLNEIFGTTRVVAEMLQVQRFSEYIGIYFNTKIALFGLLSAREEQRRK